MELAHSEERKNVDFVVRPVPVGRVSGRVVGPPEAVAGAVVRLFNDESEVFASGHEQATALVAADGTFTMVNVPLGSYVLDARRVSAELGNLMSAQVPVTPGFVRDTTSTSFLTWVIGAELGGTIRTSRAVGDAAFVGRVPIAVGPGGASDVVLRLQRAGSISGRIVSEDGRALAVTPFTADPANGNPSLVAISTGRDAFVIKGLEPGEYFLRPGLAKSIVAGGVDFTHRPFSIVAGVDITDVLVTRASQHASLGGSVRTSGGAAPREAAVIVFPVDQSQWANFGIEPPGIKSVTYFGIPKYQFPRLPAGDYFVVALNVSMRDAWLDPRFYPAAAAVATRVTLEWGKPSTQDLVIQRVTLR